MDRTQQALERMAAEDPRLAARLFVQMLPAVAQRLEGPLSYDLDIEGVGRWRVVAGGDGDAARGERGGGGGGGRVVGGGRGDAAGVERAGEGDGEVDFTIESSPEGVAALAARQSPLRLIASGKLRVTGKRRRALKLRVLANGPEPTIAEALAAGAELDADAIYRSLPYMIDPEWTRGHRFTVAYVVEGVGEWHVHVDDGVSVSTDGAAPNTTIRLGLDTYRALLSGSISPSVAMQRHLIEIEGEIHPSVLLGRWIDRSQGRDDAELEREERQRALQQRRRGSWGGRRGSGTALPIVDGGDPGHDEAGDARRGGDLM